MLESYIKEEMTSRKNFHEILTSISKKNYILRINQILEKEKSSTCRIELNIGEEKKYYELFFLFLKQTNILVLFRDITQERYEKGKLKREAEFLKNFIENNPFAIEFRDLDGYFNSANKAFLDLWQAWPPPDHSILEDHHTEQEKQTFRDAANGIYRTNLISCYNPNLATSEAPDKDFWVNVAVFPVFGIDGEVEQVACMYEDITEKVQQEKELIRLKQQLENRVRERTIKLENAERKYRKAYNRAYCFKGLFNHDISNIFQIISNSLEMTQHYLEQESNINPKILNFLDLMDKQLNRGKRLINNIRNLSEIEESEMPISKINVFENLNNAIDFVTANFPDRHVNVSVRSFTSELYVSANELLLDVFENILINSVMYNRNEIVKIDINISQDQINDRDYVKFEFKDNGIGIEDHMKDLIFQNIKGIHKNNSKGMGLGLSLVAKFIELCKGKISVENRIKHDYSKGSNFIIQLRQYINN
jgi:signal transduction histidine kinase